MASQQYNEGLLQHEVQELTEMLRKEDILGDLRAMLRQTGLEPERLLLAGFIENPEGFEGGVVISPDLKVYHFERDISESNFTTWEQVDDISPLLGTYPALRVAVEMTID